MMREFKAGDLLRGRGDCILLLMDIDSTPQGISPALGYILLSGINRFPCVCARTNTKEDSPPNKFDPEVYGPLYYIGNISVFTDALCKLEGEFIEM